MRPPQLPLQVFGLGAVTPLGLSTPATCAALRARLCAFGASPLTYQSFLPMTGLDTEPITMARLPGPFEPGDDDALERLFRAAALAVDEAVDQAGVRPTDCALIVGVRDPGREDPDFDGLAGGWLRGIERELGLRFHPASTVVARGHVSAFVGLRHAQHVLRTRQAAACVVGGVDSLCNVQDLERFVTAYRVLGNVVSKGFVPGEGAAFVVVGAARPGRSGGAPAAQIAGIGIASEQPGHSLLSGGPPTGRGLQAALEDAIADARMAEGRIQWRLSDVNGESFRIDDMLLASTRFYATYRKHTDLWHPASGLGDMGAASAAMLVVQGCNAFARGLAPGAVAMCESASDDTDRAACVLVGPGVPPS